MYCVVTVAQVGLSMYGVSAFDLLDPDPKFKDQVNCALHVSCGSYHGGVVTNDISTDYEFTPLPSAQ